MKIPSLKLPPPCPMGLSFGSGCISFISLYVISWGFVSNSLIISRLSISPSLSRSILLKISWYLSWFTGERELCLNVIELQKNHYCISQKWLQRIFLPCPSSSLILDSLLPNYLFLYGILMSLVVAIHFLLLKLTSFNPLKTFQL